MDCAACHSPDSWDIPAESWRDGALVIPDFPERSQGTKEGFSHMETSFPLDGRHAVQDCRTCHETLVFSDTRSSCISCHTDLHQMTVGDDCSRCHHTGNWLIDEVTDLHEMNGFPLLGQHALANCIDCHTSETHLRFDRIGNDCINCHLDDYQATLDPDHQAAGFSSDCMRCHDPASSSWNWTSGAANHAFFPLTGGHDIQDCNACHADNNFSGTSPECVSCHLDDFQSTTNPDHETGNFPQDCNICHTTGPGWDAFDFAQHDQNWFPIYSGKHEGEWNTCMDCHINANDFSIFSCIDCHEHNDPNDLADEHDEVAGYEYTSQACYVCHPRGDE